MSPKYIAAFVLAVFAMFGWNAFLVIRDNKMFDAYYKQTAKDAHCEQLKVWHPDCNLE